jgi:catechol 2,3-dioxygenase-like lactoylglutathione lyase family enzyme
MHGKQAAQSKLLSGGYSQIVTAEGDVQVQVYIAAMPGWKSATGQGPDALGPQRLHICFSVSSRTHLDAAYAAGLEAGGRDNGGPGYREHLAPGYYAAFLFDPDGNNIEFHFRDPAVV